MVRPMADGVQESRLLDHWSSVGRRLYAACPEVWAAVLMVAEAYLRSVESGDG
jgi:hypothetical protein